MVTIDGSTITARALKNEGVDSIFFLPGGPIGGIIQAAHKLGIRCVDVRHEQAAANMAHAYSRVTGRPGICVTASGPGTTNAVPGIANAMVDGCPVIHLGGASPAVQFGMGGFQEIDQLAVMRPITKWADRILTPRRIPELVSAAFRHATTGRPGPAYLDFPKDVVEDQVDENEITYQALSRTHARPPGDPSLIKEAAEILIKAERPIVIAGTGTFWSQSGPEFQEFVEKTNIPFFTMPQTRGIVPDDHDLSFLGSRSMAFRDADAILVMGTRFDYMLAFGQSPRFSAGAKMIQVDIESSEIGHNRAVDVGIVGDAKMVFQQLTEAIGNRRRSASKAWIDKLGIQDAANRELQEVQMESDAVPIHPLRLCKEVRDFLDRDAVLVVDGQEILNFGRQSIPSFTPGSRVNCGTFANIGTGVPFGIGAKVARPDKQVLVLTGDGSFGFHAMELDTAARNKINVITVISNNGGWASHATSRKAQPGGYLGFSDYHKMANAFGCYSERVEKPADIRPALERAAKAGVPSLINVIVDDQVKNITQAQSAYKPGAIGTKITYEET
ncbi:MAG: thiamine pyrophosphate-binding protein [Dehalococcoidia bacterium]|nr:thiamine pyrophosphate-binding protein [Dehalococcoidia bacterium]